MLQSKYLTQDGLTAWLKECYKLGFKYLFYNQDSGTYMLSEREPVFYNITFMYCNGKKYAFSSYFSTLVAEDLLDGRNCIAIEDHINVVDWSKVPVDTLILVKGDDNCWYHRHFAKYEDGRIYAWRDGMTSWSLKSCDDDNIAYIYWQSAKLVEDTSE